MQRLKVLVTGSSGALGRQIVKQSVSKGHNVIGIVRHAEGAKKLSNLQATPFITNFNSDPLKPLYTPDLTETAQGTDVIINALNPFPIEMFTSHATEEERAIRHKMRTQGIIDLCNLAKNVKAKAIILMSYIWVVQSDNIYNEASPYTSQPLYNDFVESEHIFQRELAQGSVSPYIMRFGLLYGPESFFMKKLADYLHKSKIPTLDGGTNKVSMIHGRLCVFQSLIFADYDAASAMVALAEHLGTATSRSSDVYHITDDQPIELGRVLHLLAHQIGAPEPADYPSWLASFKLNSDILSFLTSNSITSSDKFKNDFSWKPKYSTFQLGLQQTIETWKREGVQIKT